MDADEKLLSTIQLAEYLGIKTSTLREYRVDRKGPPYIKIGHLVRYKVKDIEAWLATQQH
jgi:excisionase family DNA binding protein